MTDLDLLKSLGPAWHKALVRLVEQSVCGWLLCGDSRMWQDTNIYEFHVRAFEALGKRSAARPQT